MRIFGLRLIAGVCFILSVSVISNVLLMQQNGTAIASLSGASPAGYRLIGGAGQSAGNGQRPALQGQPTRRLIRAIQRELADRDYLFDPPNGQLNLSTRAAIMAFQADHGQPLSGEANEIVLRTILLGTTGEATLGTSAVGQEAQGVIRHVQSLLSRVGYQSVGKTGRLDEATRAAITLFEKRSKMEPKGRISAELLSRLEAAKRQL